MTGSSKAVSDPTAIASESPILSVRNLEKSYGKREAVRGVSFEVHAGEVVGFLGPNGAGKSTTLRMITGYLAPTFGDVSVCGVSVVRDPTAAKRHFGYMPEGVALHLDMRVREFLSFRGELKGLRGPALRTAIERTLSEAQVEAEANRVIGTLSKGTRQRVGLADALLTDPPLLVLDEPTAGLDPNQVRHVRDLIKSFSDRKSVLVSTHILPEVEATCSRVIILDKGRIVGEGTPSELRTSLAQTTWLVSARSSLGAMVAAFAELGTVRHTNETAEGAEIEIALREGSSSEELFDAANENGIRLSQLSPRANSLEDVFARVTGDDGGLS